MFLREKTYRITHTYNFAELPLLVKLAITQILSNSYAPLGLQSKKSTTTSPLSHPSRLKHVKQHTISGASRQPRYSGENRNRSQCGRTYAEPDTL